MERCSAFADMFFEHLDTQLDEEDVQKIISGTKTKNQITVVESQLDKVWKAPKSLFIP